MCTFTIALEALGERESSLLPCYKIALSFSCITYCIVPPPGTPTQSDIFVLWPNSQKMV